MQRPPLVFGAWLLAWLAAPTFASTFVPLASLGRRFGPAVSRRERPSWVASPFFPWRQYSTWLLSRCQDVRPTARAKGRGSRVKKRG
jgi:hypothetical protein